MPRHRLEFRWAPTQPLLRSKRGETHEWQAAATVAGNEHHLTGREFPAGCGEQSRYALANISLCPFVEGPCTHRFYLFAHKEDVLGIANDNIIAKRCPIAKLVLVKQDDIVDEELLGRVWLNEPFYAPREGRFSARINGRWQKLQVTPGKMTENPNTPEEREEWVFRIMRIREDGHMQSIEDAKDQPGWVPGLVRDFGVLRLP